MSVPSDRSGQKFQGAKLTSPMQSMSSGGFDSPDEESLRDTLRIVRKRRLSILAWVVGSVAAAFLVCAVMGNQYKSTATLLVNKDTGGGLDLGGLSGIASAIGGGMDDVKTELTTHATVLQSDTTALLVIQQLGLDKMPDYKYKPGIFGWNKEMKAELGVPLEKATATRERLIKIVTSRLVVEPKSDTRLITIEYRDSDPQRAADVANAFVDVYVNEYLDNNYKATAKASDWLSVKLNDLKSKVADSQQKLSDYESKTGLSVLMLGMSGDAGGAGSGGGASLGGGMHIPAVDKLAALNQELTAAEVDRISKEAIYRLTETQSPEVVTGLATSSLAATPGSTAIGTGGVGLQLLNQLRQQEAALSMEYGDGLSKYGAKSPHLAELKGQMDALNQSIHEELQRIDERAKNDFTLAEQTENGIRQSYTKQQEEVNKLNDNTIQLEVLAGEALSNRELYEGLYSKLEAAKIQAGVSATNLILVDEARPTANPQRPNWRIYPLVGLGVGLFLGIAFAFVRESLDDSLVTTEQVEKVGLLPVLSYIPLIRPDDKLRGKQPGEEAAADPLERSLLITRPTAPAAEAYRALRTAILLSAVDDPIRVLLTTSPLGSDGKSTISYNLGIAFAQHGRKVLVIDADMRKPSMHTFFRKRKAPGLSEVLTGSVSLADALFPHVSLPGLTFLPAGTTPPNPADLLGSKRFDALLEEVKKQFDLVIIDSPPVLMVTDPVVLSTKADGTIVVVRSQRTTRPVLKRVISVLSHSQGRKLGFVVNGMDTKSVEYYYSYGYYGDNKYYGEEA
jgi:succinoglycan biosynthesis transport protein ExoP